MVLIFVPLATDIFQRANEEPLNPTNWTTNTSGGVYGDLAIVSNHCVGQSPFASQAGLEFYTGVTAPPDQFASVVIGAFPLNGQINIFLRTDRTVLNGFFGVLSGNGDGTASLQFARYTNGTPRFIGPFATIPAVHVGDVFQVGVIGTTLVAFYNGTQVVSFIDLDVRDTNLKSGLVGVGVFWQVTQTDTYITGFTVGTIQNGIITPALPSGTASLGSPLITPGWPLATAPAANPIAGNPATQTPDPREPVQGARLQAALLQVNEANSRLV